MKPFATIGSEISKVRDRVRRGAEALRPAKVASDVRDQRDRLLAKLGEQTFRLIAERKLVVPKLLQESVERLATLLGVQLPPLDSVAGATAVASAAIADGAAATVSDPLQGPRVRVDEAVDRAESIGASEVDEPSIGDSPEAGPPTVTKPPPHREPAASPRPAQKKSAKRRGKR